MSLRPELAHIADTWISPALCGMAEHRVQRMFLTSQIPDVDFGTVRRPCPACFKAYEGLQ